MIPIKPKTKPTATALELLRLMCRTHRKHRLSQSAAHVYLCLVLDGITRQFGRIPKVGVVAEMAGLSAKATKSALELLQARGLLPYGHVIATQATIERHAIDRFERMAPDEAKAQGYKPITYSYAPDERHLLDSLLAGNFDEPCVVVELERKGVVYLELWRHESALARYSQRDEVALGAGIRLGEMGEL